MSKKREEVEQEEEIDREAMLDELFKDTNYINKEKKPKKKKSKNKNSEADTDSDTADSTDNSDDLETDIVKDTDEDTSAANISGDTDYVVDSDSDVLENTDSDTDAEDADTQGAASKKKKEKKSKRKKKEKPEEINIVKDLVNLLIYIITVIIICWAVLTFVGQRTVVSGDSMNDTLSDGDNLWIDKLSYNFEDPERYDIVVFPYSEETYYIKRIIGLPGETVYIDEDGVIYINDEPLKDDIYGKETIDPSKRGVAAEPVTLGEDEYFVMGDNRNNSRDSRIEDVGNITLDQIVGKVVFRFIGGFGKIE